MPYIAKWGLLFHSGTPKIAKQKIDLEDKEFILINEASKIPIEKRKHYILLFFTEERHFNAFYSDLNETRIRFLQGFYAICSLDFSTYPGLDESENIVALKRNRNFCCFCQQNDILCIYNAVWECVNFFL